MSDRRPLSHMEARAPVHIKIRQPHSIRFDEDEWQAITESALCRGLEPAVFTRMLAIYALSIADAPVVTPASVGIPGQVLGGAPGMLAGARRIRRF